MRLDKDRKEYIRVRLELMNNDLTIKHAWLDWATELLAEVDRLEKEVPHVQRRAKQEILLKVGDDLAADGWRPFAKYLWRRADRIRRWVE